MSDTDHTLAKNESQSVEISGSELIRSEILRIVEQSHRGFCLFADDLDPRIYSNSEFTTRLSKLLRSTRRPDVRILLHRPGELLKQQHAALDLIQRLSSLIEVKTLHRQYHDQRQSYLINDQGCMLYQASCERYDALLIQAPFRITEIKNQFDQMWQQSSIAAELRRQMI